MQVRAAQHGFGHILPLLVIAIGMIGIFLGIQATKMSQDNRSRAAAPSSSINSRYSHMYHHMGVYGLDSALRGDLASLDTFVKNGFSLFLLPQPASTSALGQRLTMHKVRNLDNNPSWLIYRYCQPYMSGTMGFCPLDQVATNSGGLTRYEKIKKDLAEYLEQRKNDPNIAGYYLIDDSPRSEPTLTKKLLIDMARIIHASNSAITADQEDRGIVKKPAICAIQAYLDATYDNNGVKLPEPMPIRDNDAFLNRAISYISPEACDFIVVQAFGQHYINDPNYIDWRMTKLLPRIKDKLRRQVGWNEQTPLIANGQVFTWLEFNKNANDYVEPRPQDITAQVRAFCDQGFISFISYTGDDSASILASGKRTGVRELFNWPPYVEAYKQGIEYCKTTAWGLQTPSPSPSPVVASVKVESVRTADANKVTKTVFKPGDTINYIPTINNITPAAAAATETVVVEPATPVNLLNWTGTVNFPAGRGEYAVYPLNRTLPTNLPAGTYTFKVSTTSNRVTTQASAPFTVTSIISPTSTPVPTPQPTVGCGPGAICP